MLREAPCCDPRHHWTKRAPSKAAKAAALLDLIRIRKARNKMLATIDLATAMPHELQRLLAIDRYESCPRTRRRRASAKLKQDG
jgi:hypothetical protein